MKKITYAYPFFIILFTACVSAHVNPKRIDQNAFPEGFSDPNCILLIQKRTSGINARGMNNYLKKSFRKHYTGKYEMASRDEIENNPKYQDKKIYRFVLSDEVWTNRSSTTTRSSTGVSIQYNNSYRLDYRLYDREIDKSYPEIGVSSNVPAKAMKRVAATLNAQLHK
jgi:hypothetical protein